MTMLPDGTQQRLPIRIAVVGLGKIARDQHLPAIAADPRFHLAATVDLDPAGVADVPAFPDLDALVAAGVAIDAVALCTPPQVRRSLAMMAIAQGWHVLLEKPPGATLSEVEALAAAGRASGVTLFAAWHSRFATGVEAARTWLAERTIIGATITWREDVRVWHPGQHWIWQPGGFGVFDPGINALSIATRILPNPFFVTTATLEVPANLAAPIAARVNFSDSTDAPITMDLDFRQQGPQHWDIRVDTDAGTLLLANGGATLTLPDGARAPTGDTLPGEYAALYNRFGMLIAAGRSDVDVAPLRHVADAYMVGCIERVASFVV